MDLNCDIARYGIPHQCSQCTFKYGCTSLYHNKPNPHCGEFVPNNMDLFLNDTITYCDSSYEVIYANYLIRNNINFEYHTKILKLSDGCRYIPDFYLIDEDTFVEIKAKHWAKENLYKSIECKDMNYKIIILDYNELRELDNIPYVCSSGILRAARKSGIKEEDYLAQSLYLKQLKR